MVKITFRVPEEVAEWIEAREESKSELCRSAVREYMESYEEKVTDADVREFLENGASPEEKGFRTYMAGIVMRDKDLADHGGDILLEANPDIGEVAAEYLSRFGEDYWE